MNVRLQSMAAIAGMSAAFVLGVFVGQWGTPASDWPDYSAVYTEQAQSVVGIRGAGDSAPVGTGFSISPTRIVTVRHLVVGVDEVTAHTLDGRAVEMRVVGTDARTDLALLESTVAIFTPVKLGNAGPAVGHTVAALGHPYGLGHSLAVGTVSGQNRRMASSDTEFLQLNIGLNPGNSGGPLYNSNGEVVGVLTGLHAQGQAIAFAVPVEALVSVLPALEQGSRVSRAFLGVRGEVRDDGVEIASIIAASPAANAGLRVGDRLLALGDQKVKSLDDLAQALDAGNGGTTVVAEVLRDGQPLRLDVVLADWAEHPVVTGGMTLSPFPGSGGEVLAVRPGSRAEKAGIRRGDRLRAIDGRPVQAPADVLERLSGSGARSVDLWREGVVLTVQLSAPG